MARRKFQSRAEELRHHRKCFELAMELGCTPAEAETMIARVEARERYRALCLKHGFRRDLPALTLPKSRAEFERWDAAWMMRD